MIVDSLAERMKLYELPGKSILPRRLPVIIRIDGKSFNTYTKDCVKPFDINVSNIMVNVTKKLCEEIQGAQFGYTQSDEASILIHSYKTFKSVPWYDNQIQKMVSVAAGIASATFTAGSLGVWNASIKPAVFDARAFVLPEADVANYFIWRQKDATSNSMASFARTWFSTTELYTKGFDEMYDMCSQQGHDWNVTPPRFRRGIGIAKEVDATTGRSSWVADLTTPDFCYNRAYVERHLKIDDALPPNT